MARPLRVDAGDEDLDFDPVNWNTLYKGVPFTGEMVEYDEEGNLVEYSVYENGSENGPERVWYPDGRLKVEGTLRTGLPQGVWRTWHPNGRLARRTEFDDAGNQIRIQHWDPEGVLIRDTVYAPMPRTASDRAFEA
ncbi:toxin-antitoxin system YwqK family antitoxin [Nocardiopsis algeriensis]|uniref:Antitoxin component YwqK of YwqJK toxin-antitoxin module n=1 Tax=Nocardiopsis algeriensis TaxID=1478215 RepID=A0A841IQI0_9ACTN|nr:hypothetical protein [Nocardiopsis algeriensis]MBB6118581.1 antitoxin component YwqK of YwqJK toxin-antitoxin module [Nocardiopsis algeriensis]